MTQVRSLFLEISGKFLGKCYKNAKRRFYTNMVKFAVSTKLEETDEQRYADLLIRVNDGGSLL